MAYEDRGGNALDYFPCRYGKSKLMFRGPKRRLEGRYVAMIGGSETYGKFVAQPYPALVEEKLGRKVVNFGLMNAGLDVFSHDTTIRDSCSRARVTVVQIGGAQNMSNRFYAVHPRRNDRFLRASALLKTIYPEVDFTEFHYTRHLLRALRADSAEKFALVEQELKQAWTARMKTLVAQLDTKVVLLWLSDHGPDESSRWTPERAEPLFVDRAMLAEVAPYVEGLVEVVADPGEIAAGRAGLVYGDLEAPAAQEMLGAVAHEKAAAALVPVIARLM